MVSCLPTISSGKLSLRHIIFWKPSHLREREIQTCKQKGFLASELQCSAPGVVRHVSRHEAEAARGIAAGVAHLVGGGLDARLPAAGPCGRQNDVQVSLIDELRKHGSALPRRAPALAVVVRVWRLRRTHRRRIARHIAHLLERHTRDCQRCFPRCSVLWPYTCLLPCAMDSSPMGSLPAKVTYKDAP